jgi:benzoylformate decarboxylase
MRGRDVFLDSLRLHGATKIFGNPGTTETPLLDNLSDYPDIEYIFNLYEAVAVCSAGFYARASGETAIANMHAAPGLGNAIGMIYGALKSNAPMIVTAGAQDSRLRLRDPLLGHDLVAIAKPVTKWSVQLEHADEMATVMQRAFKIANEHPKGPVFVALPINVLEQETKIAATAAGELSTNGKADADALLQLAEMIKTSKSVGIVAGDDVAYADATDSLIALSEKIGAGIHLEIVTSRVPFPVHHPHFRGRIGSDAVQYHRALGDYDLVLMIGGPFFEEVWHTDASPFADDATVVQLEPSATRLAHNYPLTLGIVGEINDALTQLLELVGEAPAYVERRGALAEMYDVAEQAANERFETMRDKSPMTPARALYELAQAVPDDVVLVEEVITASPDVMRNFDIGGVHESYGCRGGGIGQGMAGCVGTALARPDQQVIAMTGDGSAMYSIQVLWTAAHYNLNILFIILSNREYRVLKHNLEQYRSRFGVPSNKPYSHMDLTQPFLGFSEMAGGMGVPAKQISKPEEIAVAVAEALATDGPYLLDLLVEGLES